MLNIHREINTVHYTLLVFTGFLHCQGKKPIAVSQIFQILFPLNDVTNVMVTTIPQTAWFLPLATG